MKYLITIALLALTVGVKAQTKTMKTIKGTTHDSTGNYTFSGTLKASAVTDSVDRSIWKYTEGFKTIMNSPSLHIFTDTKPIMSISTPKPDGSYDVWIDKKAIVWTSDNTFVLKKSN